MGNVSEAFAALSRAYNDSEPVGTRVAVEVRAKWHRWCVSCRKNLRPSARWKVVNNHVFCMACDKRLTKETAADAVDPVDGSAGTPPTRDV